MCIRDRKKVAGTLRLSLAQYREKQAFAQFGSDLDAVTRQQLARGERLVELLKQAQFKPTPVELQVVSITAANLGLLDDLEVSEILDYEAKLHQSLRANNSSLLDIITTKGALSKEENQSLADLSLIHISEPTRPY